MDAKKQNLEFHARGLKSKFPDADCKISGDTLIWRWKLTPNVFSKIYDVTIKYKVFSDPIVKVSPIGMQIPVEKSEIHMYTSYNPEEDGSLCLYDRTKKQWTPKMAIVEYIVPWICEWLYFYEIWLITHKWCG